MRMFICSLLNIIWQKSIRRCYTFIWIHRPRFSLSLALFLVFTLLCIALSTLEKLWQQQQQLQHMRYAPQCAMICVRIRFNKCALIQVNFGWKGPLSIVVSYVKQLNENAALRITFVWKKNPRNSGIRWSSQQIYQFDWKIRKNLLSTRFKSIIFFPFRLFSMLRKFSTLSLNCCLSKQMLQNLSK